MAGSGATIGIGTVLDHAVAGVGLKATNGSATLRRTGVVPPRTTRLAGLDGLRAIAIVAVLLFHAGVGSLPGGFLGVDLFFVISGFLITSILVAEFQREGRISLRDFYLRRARRLLPALLAMLAVLAGFMAVFFRGDLAQARGDIAAALGYVSNWWYVLHHRSYFVAAGRPEPLQHLWSLAVEEQFYLVWPVVLTALLCLRGRLRSVVGIAVVGALGSAFLMRSIAIRGNVPFDTDSSRVYFGTDTHASALLVGAAAAAAMAAIANRSRGRSLPRWVRAALDVVGLAGLGAVCWSMHAVSYYSPGLYRGGFLAFAVVTVVVVVSASAPGGWLGPVLDVAPLRWIGARSYGLYLWHWPVFVYTRPGLDWPLQGPTALAARLAITAVLTELSYRVVEVPLRRRGSAATWHPRRVAGPWRVVAPVLGAVLGVIAVIAATTYGASRVRVHSGVTGRVAAAPASEGAIAAPASPAVSSAVASPPAPASATLAAPTSSSELVSRPVMHAPTPAAHPTHSIPAAATTPPAIPGGAPPSVSAVGDSVLLDAAKSLKADCAGTEVYAVVGWQAKAVFAELAALRAVGHLGTDVVIETGTNGIVSSKELDAVLASLADRHKVVVVNDHMDRPWEPPNNAMFPTVVQAHPNAVLVDWDAAATAHPDWLSTDDVHLKLAGRAPYAALIKSAAGC